MAANLLVSMTVRMKDEFSSGLKTINNSLGAVTKESEGRLRDARGRFVAMGEAASDAGRKIKGAGSSMSGLGDAARRVGGLMRGAFSGVLSSVRSLTGALFSLKSLVAGIVAGQLVRSFVSVASSIEKAKIQLETLLGSAEKANDAFARLKRLAEEVSVDFDDLVSGAGSLAAVANKSSKELDLWLRIAADIQGAFSTLTFDEVASNLQRALSAGAASADLFQQKGVNAFLGFKAGVAISAEDTRKQILKVWNDAESGLKGAAQRMNSTWDGIMSQLRDRWFEFRRIVFVDSGLGDALKNRLGELNDQLQAAFRDPTPYVEKFKAVLIDILSITFDIISAMVRLGNTIVYAFSSGAGAVKTLAGSIAGSGLGFMLGGVDGAGAGARIGGALFGGDVESWEQFVVRMKEVADAYEEQKQRIIDSIQGFNLAAQDSGNLGDVTVPDYTDILVIDPLAAQTNAYREALSELKAFHEQMGDAAKGIRERYRAQDLNGIRQWAAEQQTILEGAYAASYISAEEYQFAVQDLARETKERMDDATKSTLSFAEQFAKALKEKAISALNDFGSAVADTFANVVSGTQSAGEAFREFVKSAIASLVKLIAQIAIFSAIGAAIGLFTGAGAGLGARIGAAAGSSGGFTSDSFGKLVGGPPIQPAGRGAGQPPQVTNINIQAMDAPSFQQYLAANGGGVITSIQENNLRRRQSTRNAVRG